MVNGTKKHIDILKLFSSSELLAVHHGDARMLSQRLPHESVDVTITSPPYFDMKDYGAKNQIGYGQNYKTYLSDLQLVFSNIFRATKSRGSLWVVIDSFCRNQEVIPLPFDLVAQLKQTGWKLRDVIIWKKERTLPWTHIGTTRKIFEYILVFSKNSGEFNYYPDTHRETTDLKRWWVRYPERYNPKGKSLEEIWSYDIPTQGSWGNSYLQHFCPLPSDLVSRIIGLTTKPGDVVLDPFSGSGTVPTTASLMNRKFIGFEINKKYIRMFNEHLRSISRKKISENPAAQSSIENKKFEETILNLRTLKYARMLYRILSKKFVDTNIKIFTRRLREKTKISHKLIAAEFIIFGIKTKDNKQAKYILDDICNKPPLSKYGIDHRISFINKIENIPSCYRTKKVFLYTKTNSHKFLENLKINDIKSIRHPLISTIEASVEEPDG